MHLLRVKVPKYRALENVDITFEKEFIPRVFPLGSQNGGGKSTLLQLIFTLLHCSSEPERLPYLQNMLEHFQIGPGDSLQTLAEFEIWDGEKVVKVEFLVINSTYLHVVFERHELLCITESDLNQQNFTLFCRIQDLDANNIKLVLKHFAKKIFLVAPSTQIYLFLSAKNRKQLFKASYAEYQKTLDEAKGLLPGFSTYDFFSIGSIIQFFELARTMDFAEKVKTGSYGNNYDKLFVDINALLVAKQVSPLPDLSGITFKLNNGNGDMELFPEDLSHGEMKRLIIYSWLKAKQIEDSIVLMDEIEIALHPDWQGQIVDDLLEWAGSNQYILATHSMELCRAVTPAHVKELPPTLMPRR